MLDLAQIEKLIGEDPSKALKEIESFVSKTAEIEAKAKQAEELQKQYEELKVDKTTLENKLTAYGDLDPTVALEAINKLGDYSKLGDAETLAKIKEQFEGMSDVYKKQFEQLQATLLGKDAELKDKSVQTQTLEEQLAEIKSQMDQQLKLQQEESAKRLEDLENKWKDAEKKAKKATIDSAVSQQLAELKVNEKLINAASRLWKAENYTVTEDGQVLFGKDKTPLAQVMKAWAETDEGKGFISAPINDGGTSPSNPSSVTLTPDSKKPYMLDDGETLNLTALYMELNKQTPDPVAVQIAKDMGQ